MSKPVWEQLDNEPIQAYTRFLIYRNLGPARSLDDAFEVYKESNPNRKATKSHEKPLQLAGNWIDDSSRYLWVERASQWDIDMMSSVGKQVMQNLCDLFQKLTLKLISWIDEENIAPSNITEYRQLLNDVSTLFNPSTIAAFGQLSSHVEPGYTEATFSTEPTSLTGGEQ